MEIIEKLINFKEELFLYLYENSNFNLNLLRIINIFFENLINMIKTNSKILKIK